MSALKAEIKDFEPVRPTAPAGGVHARRRPGPAMAQTIGGRYALQSTVGGGGMGLVFLATDTYLKREVAIKILHPRLSDDPLLRRMFMREAETMAELRHPNVMDVYDLGHVDGVPYFVMPYWTGTDLNQWCTAHGGPPIAPDLAVAILAEVCAGLSAMHAKSLIHGDIKPENILVSDEFEVALADLGLAYRISDRDCRLPRGGTPGYASPEWHDPTPAPASLAPRADVYSLGVTAYWLLTGRVPTDPAPAPDTPIPAPSRLRPGLPTVYDAPVLSALRPDPRDRPDLWVFGKAMLTARDDRPATRPTSPFVVLVDDDPMMLMFVEEVVRHALGYAEIVSLQDPQTALSIIRNRTPDLVITDLHMPKLDGIELTASLRRRAQTRELPIIVLTGVGGAAEWQKLHELGATRILLKPVDPDSLYDVVRRMLGGPMS